MDPQIPSTLASRRIHDGKRISLRLDTVQIGDRPVVEREIVEHPGSVVIVPVTDKETVLLIRQWRQPAGEVILEAPAGTLDSGEDAESTALRELREEAGVSAGRLISMGGSWVAPGYSTEYTYAYLATDLRDDPLPQDDGEDIHVVETPLAQVPELIRSGQLRDQMSIAALCMGLYLYRDELKHSQASRGDSR